MHRLIIVDDNQHILGIFSMSDLMRFLVSTFESKPLYISLRTLFFFLDTSRTNSNTSNSNSNGPIFEDEPMDT